MYIKETLQFSILPTLLLLTTVFRIALNVSSTRLILSNSGSAGKVIKIFGDFVLSGNIVIGFVVFLIVVAVQFIVIVKGSERVAEVAARFTLDAMPGKQMAIDADLSAGIISEQEAVLRRSKIQREADFFGAMDGASKFVKGDAILSIIVVLVNFFGGLIVGMVEGGSSFKDVLSKYSIATVGDGLVSQLPSLMISIATGIIVTRAASKEDLHSDLFAQFTSQPYALIITGGVLMGFLLIPGFPKIATFLLGGLLVFLGIRLLQAQKEYQNVALRQKKAEAAQQSVKESDYYKKPESLYDLLFVDPMELEFGYSLIEMVSDTKEGNFLDRIVMLRKQFALDNGVVFPSIRLKDSNLINPNQYVIKVRGEEVARGEILVGYILALNIENSTDDLDGIDAIEPAYGIPSKWILKSEKEKAEALGYTLIEPTSVIIAHLSEVIKHYIHELFSRKDVEMLLENLKKTNGGIVEGIIPEIVSLVDFHKILSNLLREFIPIKDLETIINAIAENAVAVKDIDLLTEYVRQSLKRTITRAFASSGNLMVIVISPKVEKLITANLRKADKKTYLSLEPEIITEFVNSVKEQLEKHKDVFVTPIILTSSMIRVHISRLLETFISNIVVLSFNEIENSVQVLAIGNVDLKEAEQNIGGT
jgi:flagellar biosynthesis protein FlhA